MRGPEGSISKSFDAECPACVAKRIHTEDEWKLYHPLAGKGHSREHGSPLKKDKP